MKQVLFALGFLFFANGLMAQALGLNPSTIKWEVLKTPAVNVIYEKGMEAQAQRTANIINLLDEEGRRSIGDKERKFDLLIRNHSAIPNGYVGLAPFRSEFFATQPESPTLLGSMNFLDVLSIHEHRHTLQNMNTRRGLSLLAYLVAGEGGLTIANIVSIPNWYSEGDAVIIETAMSNAGRGRTPSFTKGMRAMANEGVRLRYGKWRNGSFQDFTPDHYRLGYMMLTHFRNEKGNDLIKDVHSRASTFRDIIYPFSFAMRSESGMKVSELYKDSWQQFSTQWKQQQALLKLTNSTRITPAYNIITNFAFPQESADGSIYAIESSLRETAYLVKIDGDYEEKILDIGVTLTDYFDMQDNAFVWTEFGSSPRRSNVEYSDILMWDEKGKRRLTDKKKFFSPVFVEDRSEIVAVEIHDFQDCSIVVLNHKNGKEIQRYKLPKNTFAMRPAMINTEEVAYILQQDNRLVIQKLNLRSETITNLTNPTHHVIDGLEYYNGHLYYTAAYTGIDNIFRVDVGGSKTIEQITSVKIAAADPHVSKDGKSLYYTEFSTDGTYISKANLDLNSVRSSYTVMEPVDMDWMDYTAEEAEGGNILDRIPTTDYKSKRYSGLFRGMRLHSWNLSPSIATPGVSLQFDNVLSDASIRTNLAYNINEKGLTYGGSVRMAKYFPVIDLNGQSQHRQDSILSGGSRVSRSYTDNTIGGGVFVPINFLKGNYSHAGRIGVSAGYNVRNGLVVDGEEIDPTNFTNALASASYSTKRRTARQNMRSRLGFSINTSINFMFNNEEADNKEFLDAKLYLPGLSKNHSTLIGLSAQREDNAKGFRFVDGFEYPRGTSASDYFDYDNGIRGSIDYAFPLAYPDFGILGIVYFKRVKANLYFDYGIFEGSPVNNRTARSFGIEWFLDNVFLNVIPVTMGFRTGYRNLAGQGRLVLGPIVGFKF